jgi:adenylosuccinate synthase
MRTKPVDVGIRTADALVSDVLRSRIERNLEDANRIIEAYGGSPLNVDEIFDEMSALTERLSPFIADTTHYLNVAATEGRSIPSRGCSGNVARRRSWHVSVRNFVEHNRGRRYHRHGLAPHRLSGVLGIVRTYTTRVGEGPFPTEMVAGEEELAN